MSSPTKLLFPHGLGDVIQALPSFAEYARVHEKPLRIGVLSRIAACEELLKAQPWCEEVIPLRDPWNDFQPANTWDGFRAGRAAIEAEHPDGLFVATTPPTTPLDPRWCKSYRIACELGVAWKPNGWMCGDLSWADGGGGYQPPHYNPASNVMALHGETGNPAKNIPIQTLQGFDEKRECVVFPLSLDGRILSLREQVSVLRTMRSFVGADSAVAHLAAALGVPTITVFHATPAHQSTWYWRIMSTAHCMRGARTNWGRLEVEWLTANASVRDGVLHPVPA